MFKTTYGKWIVLAAALLAVAIAMAAVMNRDNTPRTVAEKPTEDEVTFDLESNRVYTAEDGVVVIPAASTKKSPVLFTDDPDVLWAAAPVTGSAGYTLPQEAQMANGSLGVLHIPSLSLSVNVYETDDEMEAMSHGVAHFKTTSAWQGNIGLCGHNVNLDLSDGFFKNIHTLSEGDTITYHSALGEREYTVTTVKEIAQDDWSYLGRTEDNRLTLVTCITGKPASRLVVQGVEKS